MSSFLFFLFLFLFFFCQIYRLCQVHHRSMWFFFFFSNERQCAWLCFSGLCILTSVFLGTWSRCVRKLQNNSLEQQSDMILCGVGTFWHFAEARQKKIICIHSQVAWNRKKKVRACAHQTQGMHRIKLGGRERERERERERRCTNSNLWGASMTLSRTWLTSSRVT